MAEAQPSTDEPVPHLVGRDGDYLSTRCCTYPPVATIVFVALVVILHFGVDDKTSWRYGDTELPGVEWYASLSATLSHVDDNHALYNAVVRTPT